MIDPRERQVNMRKSIWNELKRKPLFLSQVYVVMLHPVETHKKDKTTASNFRMENQKNMQESVKLIGITLLYLFEANPFIRFN